MNWLKRWFTPRDTLQTIDMIGCIVTGFMKKMQYNAQNYAAGIHGNYHESSDCFEYHNSLLKSSYPKKYLLKKSWNQKFQTLKNPSINHVNWNPEYPRRWVRHNVPTREISAVGTNLSFVFNLNNSQNVYEQIYLKFPFWKTFWLNSPAGPPCFVPLARDYGVLGFQSSSICCACPWYAVLVLIAMWLSWIRRTCSRYAVPVLNTLCLSAIRCACPKYAVPVLNTLSWPFAVPVCIRNWILTRILLYTVEP